MPGRLAVDFGTSHTVLAVWDAARPGATSMHISSYGSLRQQGDEQISVIPSVIHYTADRRQWIGQQVLDRNLYHSPGTFRWMKRYISHRSMMKKQVNGREIAFPDAGRDFLSTVLLFASEELSIGDEEVALTLPVEAFEHYEDWLMEVAEAAGIRRFRMIDEPSAAALGYGAHIQPGDVYLIFDFGGGTLDVAIVLIEEFEQMQSGRRCRVLGKAGADVGGASIDQWLFQEALRQNGRSDADEDVRQISNILLVECEQAKEQLSFHERVDMEVISPYTGAVLSAEFTRGQFEELLDQQEAFTEIDRTIRRALNAARERGYREDDIKAVLMVGGCSLIPSIQTVVRRIFDRDRVMLSRPLDAVARGAAAFVTGIDLYDHIQHDYAIKAVDSQRGGYDYRVLVRRGTPYPTQTLARLTLKATHDDQRQLGIAIYEIGEQRRRSGGRGPVELVFDPSGAARVMQITANAEEKRTYFWMNEGNPTFLTTNPPVSKGERCFEVEFSIDSNKRLLITARDLRTGQTTHRDHPVIKLT